MLCSLERLLVTLLYVAICTPLLSIAQSTTNTATDSYNILKADYESGKRDYSVAPRLVEAALAHHEKAFADRVASDYINNFLLKLANEKLYTKENLEFVGWYLPGTKDRGFRLFYPDGTRVNAVFAAAKPPTGLYDRPGGYAVTVVDRLVAAEEVEPYLEEAEKTGRDVPWDKIKGIIAKKYTREIADECVVNQKLFWYWKKSEWPEAIASFTEKVDKQGFESINDLGLGAANHITDLFVIHSDDPVLLAKAIGWEKRLLEQVPEAERIGDYCNLGALLYKTGHHEEGVSYCEKRLADQLIAEARANIGDPNFLGKFIDDFVAGPMVALERMRNGEKIDSTWKAQWFY